MKILLFVLLFAATSPATPAWETEFCKGWKDGYCEGYKDVKGQMALCPLTPLCPLPEIGENTYKGGYHRGFKAGMKKAKEE